MSKTMSRIFNYSVIILLACLLLQACVGAAVSGANAAYNHNAIEKKFSDYSIAIQANHVLEADPYLEQNARISAAVFHRLILLVGQVPNESLRQRAIADVQQVPGAIRIYNFISVEEPISFWTRQADTWITAKIRSKIITDSELDPSKVKVVTENRVVYLMGIVTKQDADRIVEMARNTNGVNKVVKLFFYMTMPELK